MPYKIGSVLIREIRVPFSSGFSGATYKSTARAALLCQITASNDETQQFTGMVCVGNEEVYSDELKNLIRVEFRGYLVGRDPTEIEKHWNHMLSFDTTLANRKDVMCAIATVDAALWDLKGKIHGLPVWKLLGGYSREVPIIGIGGYYETCMGEEGIRKAIQRYRELELGGIKFKIGKLSVKEEVERVRLVREEAGPDFILVLDSNRAWDQKTAISFARLVAPYKPEWFEEPLYQRLSVDGLKKVSSATGVPVCAGQSEQSVFYARHLLGAVDVLNVTYNRGGGISGWIKVAHAAFLSGVSMSQVAEPHIGMHLMAGISNGTYVECYPEEERDPFWANLYVDTPKPAKGTITVPEGPGFGLAFRDEVVEKYAVEAWS